jgi:hypothetical protein
MIIKPTSILDVGWAIFLAAILVFIGFAGSFYWPFVIAFFLVLYGIGEFFGNRVVIDRLTDSATVKKRYFLLIPRKRAISLSTVRNVVVDYRRISGAGRMNVEEWYISLSTDGEKAQKFRIGQADKRAYALHIASEISGFIEKGLVDNSAKPGFS